MNNPAPKVERTLSFGDIFVAFYGYGNNIKLYTTPEMWSLLGERYLHFNSIMKDDQGCHIFYDIEKSHKPHSITGEFSQSIDEKWLDTVEQFGKTPANLLTVDGDTAIITITDTLNRVRARSKKDKSNPKIMPAPRPKAGKHISNEMLAQMKSKISDLNEIKHSYEGVQFEVDGDGWIHMYYSPRRKVC